MAQVSLSRVSKVYAGNVTAVKSIDLEIRDKEFMVLVGPSGCGKSTTLRMIAGLEKISCGTIKIGDTVVNDIPPKDRDIAMVFQNYALYPHMSIYDNMAFGLKLRGYEKPEIDRRVMEAAAILGIDDYLKRKPKALSGGQRQRVALGRAIVRKPEVFLFDEPLSNLDAKMRVQMRSEISKLHVRLDTTMIYVTHDQIEAMTMGERICVMKDGVIQQVDAPLEIYDNPVNMFVADFIGTPPMNFFHGDLEFKDGRCVFHEGDFDVELPAEWNDRLSSYHDRKIVFGIRPEDISWTKAADSDAPRIKASIAVIEPMGAETYLYLTTARHSFIAKVESRRDFRVGDKLTIPVFIPKTHVFDPETQLRVV